jgi:poly(glycerol-phosphate) alpha-glucosyltransferase
MNISYITSTLSRLGAGVSYSVRSFADQVKLNGYRIKTFGLNDRFWKEDQQYWNSEVEAFSVFGPAFFGYSRKMSKSLFDFNPDILHLHGLWKYSSILARNWKTKTNKNLIISPHGMMDDWALNNSLLKKKMALIGYEKDLWGHANCFHALNQQEYRAIRKQGLNQPIAIIPLGIDMPELVNADKTESEKERKILYLGRIHPKKIY